MALTCCQVQARFQCPVTSYIEVTSKSILYVKFTNLKFFTTGNTVKQQWNKTPITKHRLKWLVNFCGRQRRKTSELYIRGGGHAHLVFAVANIPANDNYAERGKNVGVLLSENRHCVNSTEREIIAIENTSSY